MPTSSQALHKIRSGDPAQSGTCQLGNEHLDILQMANDPFPGHALSTLKPDKCLLTQVNLRRIEGTAHVPCQSNVSCSWPNKCAIGAARKQALPLIPAEAQGDGTETVASLLDQHTLPAIGSVHAHTGQVTPALAQANLLRLETRAKDPHNCIKIIDCLSSSKTAVTDGSDDMEDQSTLLASCYEGTEGRPCTALNHFQDQATRQEVLQTGADVTGGLADPRAARSPNEFAFSDKQTWITETQPPCQHGGNLGNTKASTVSNYSLGPADAIYKPRLPGFYSKGSLDRNVPYALLPSRGMRQSASGDGENLVHLMDDTQPMRGKYGTDMVQCLNTVTMGACGVLTFNKTTGRHEWKLLNSSHDENTHNRGAMRGNRRKVAVRPGKQTLPSGLWVSPYEKMEQKREEEERSKFGSLPSIFDLTLRVGKGIGVTGVLDVQGKHINLPGKRGLLHGAPIRPYAAEDIIHPLDPSSNQGQPKQNSIASHGESAEVDCRLPPSQNPIVMPRIVIRKASPLSATDQVGELEGTNVGEDRVQSDKNKSGHIEIGKCQIEERIDGTKKRDRGEITEGNIGESGTSAVRDKGRDGETSKETVPKEEGPAKHNLKLPRFQGVELWERSEDGWHHTEDVGTCQGEFSRRWPRSGAKHRDYLQCPGFTHSGSDSSSDGQTPEPSLVDMAGADCEKLRLDRPSMNSSRPYSTYSTESERMDKFKGNAVDVNFSACALNVSDRRRSVLRPGMDAKQREVQEHIFGDVICQTNAERLNGDVRESQIENDSPDSSLGRLGSLVVPPPFSRTEARRLASSPINVIPPPRQESLSGARLLRRFNHAVLRMRTELPAPDPSKLCFQSNIPGCTHAEILQCLEAAFPDVKVASLQYDPIHLQDYRDPLNSGLRFKCMWLFRLTPESDPTKLFLRGFRLRGQRMNIRRADDVYTEEQRAFKLCWEMLRRGLVADGKGQEVKEREPLGRLKNNSNVYRAAERKPARGGKRLKNVSR